MLPLLTISAIGNAATVRDDFVNRVYSNNDGTVNWNGDSVEVDGNGGGPTGGNVWITGGSDELRLEDQPNTGGQPSATREANLLGATIATWNFDWRTTGGVDASDAGDDVSFSNDGGATFTYAPTADANGVDLTVTHIRINPKSNFLGNTGSGDPSFEAYFKAIVQ